MEKCCPPELKCRNCDNEGHFARDCKEERKEGFVLKTKPAKEPRKCRNCNEAGHFIKECPKPVEVKKDLVSFA